MLTRPPTTATRQGSVEEAAASRDNEKNISQRLALEAAKVKKGLGDGNKQRDVSHAVMPMLLHDTLRQPVRLRKVQCPDTILGALPVSRCQRHMLTKDMYA